MNKKNHTTPVKITLSPWKLTLPGKILAICICILPFLTRSICITLSDAETKAYFLSDSVQTDFEQLCREIILFFIAIIAVIWFCYERWKLRPCRTFPVTKITIVTFILLGIYLIIGLLSSILSEYTAQTWFGIYMLYEGYVALVAYVIIFASAWYWIDREEVVQFVKKCLTILGIVIGILAIAEQFGMHYYNNIIVHWLGNLNGEVGTGETSVLTFGNSDYLGMYCAMLLPIVVSQINLRSHFKNIFFTATSAVLLAYTLLSTKVMNAIIFGFSMTILLLIIWIIRSNWVRTAKILVTSTVVIAFFAGCTGFLVSRTGSTIQEKMEHLWVGIEQTDTFQLLSMDIEKNKIIFQNADTEWIIAMENESFDENNLRFYCDGNEVKYNIKGDTFYFYESALSNCYVQFLDEEQQILVNMGYPTAIQANWNNGSWNVVGTGGTLLTSIPKVSQSKSLQQCYTFLNGRVFVWANTFSLLKNCILLGNGPATTIFYLNQNDLPALLNIFGTYVLYNKPHCWYLQIAQDTGIISLICILGVLTVFFVYGVHICFSKKHKWSFFRTGLLIGIGTYCLTALLNDSMIYHAPMFWFILGLGLRQMMIADQQIEKTKK